MAGRIEKESTSRIPVEIRAKLNGKQLYRHGLIALFVAAVYFISILIAPLFASYFPFLAVVIGWINFILPGIMLSFVLMERITWLDRIPLSFVLSIGISTPYTIAAILLRLSLSQFQFLATSTFLLVLVIYLIDRGRERQLSIKEDISLGTKSQKLNWGVIFFLVVLLSTVGFLLYMSANWPPAGDDISGLPIFEETLRLGRITSTEPFHGTGTPSTPRNELIVWTTRNILTCRISGTNPIDYFMGTRAVLIFMAFLSLNTFLYHLLKRRDQVIFLLGLWAIYLLATVYVDGVGSDLITRIFQDKFVGWFVVVPVLLVFMLRVLERANWRHIVCFSIGALGATLVHPITLTQVFILGGSFTFIYLIFERSRDSKRGLSWIGLILMLCFLLLAIQYFRYQSRMPIEEAGLADAVEYGRIRMAVNRYRLWLLDGNLYILHPSILLRPVILLAYALLPVFILQLRRSNAARLIVASMISMPLLFYFPPLAYLVGRLVTPYLIWRLAWPMETFAIVIIGLAIWMLGERVIPSASKYLNRSESFIQFTYSLIVILSFVFLFRNDIQLGLVSYTERLSKHRFSTCNKSAEALSYLDSLAQDHYVNVLASEPYNFCIPAYAALANVIEYRGLGTVNRLPVEQIGASLQRVDDVVYFGSANRVDDKFLTILSRYEIDYIFLERERMDLDLQLRSLSEMFARVYADQEFAIYSVKSLAVDSPIVAANSALRLENWEQAEELFNQDLQSDQGNLLAYLGLGEVYEARGELTLALETYLRAVKIAVDEPVVHSRIALTNMMTGDPDQAIKEFEKALSLSPDQSYLHEFLGRAYLITGNEDLATSHFEKWAAIRAPENSAAYHTILGDQLSSVKLYDKAIEYYQEALRIEPDPYRFVDLGQALYAGGRTQEAVQTFEQAIELDRWLYSPHFSLGLIYQSQGELEQAIEEYDSAWKLNPAFNSAFILLGQAIKKVEGTEPAISRLEGLVTLNDVLPGPHIGLASLYVARGESASALKEFEYCIQITPRNAAIHAAKGYLLLSEGEISQANQSFDTSIRLDPNLISVQLGQSILYTQEARSSDATSQLMSIMHSNPFDAWPHIYLAQTYLRQTRWEAANQEVGWALALDPSNASAYVMAGYLHRLRADWDQAISSFERAYELEQDNIDYLLPVADIYMELGDFESAREVLDKAKQVDPSHLQFNLKEAEYYWRQGFFESAISIQEAALEAHPDAAPAYLALANSYNSQGRFEEANVLFERVIEADPNYVAAYTAIAQLESEKVANFDSLSVIYQEMIESNQSSSYAYLSAGRFLIQRGQLDLAEKSLRVAIPLRDVTPDVFVALSDVQQMKGKRDEAIETLLDALSLFPGDASAHTELGRIYLSVGDTANAEISFGNSIKSNPINVPAYEGLSQIALAEGDYERAEKNLGDLVAEYPQLPDAYHALGRFYAEREDFIQAETNFKRAIDLKPMEAKYYLSLAGLLQQENRVEDALQLLNQVADEIPLVNSGISLKIGDLYLGMHQTEAALQNYQKALQAERSNSAPYIAIANLHKSQGEWDDALNTLNGAVSIFPLDAGIHYALGMLHQDLSHFEEAKYHYEVSYSSNQKLVEPLIALGELYGSSGDMEAAIGYFNQAIENFPIEIAPYLSLGRFYQSAGSFDDAQEAFTRGIQNSLERQSGFMARASFYFHQGEWDLAREDYEAAWDLNPLSYSTGLKLAEFYFKRGSYQKSLSLLQDLMDYPSSDEKVYVNFGLVYESQADFTSAAEAYKDAIEITPDSTDAYFGLARILQLQGQMDESREQYLAAVNVSPNSSLAHVYLGDAYVQRMMYPEAKLAYEKAASLDPSSIEVVVKLDDLSKIMYGQGIEITEYLIEADTAPTTELFTTIADLYQRRGEFEQAESWLRYAIDVFPNQSQGWAGLGNYHRVFQDWDASIDALLEAIRIDPTSSSLYLSLGSVEQNLELDKQAVETFSKAIEVDPLRVDGYIALSHQYFRMGQVDEAIETIREGVAIHPSNDQGYIALSKLYRMKGERELALQTIQQGLDILPGSADLHTSLGELYLDRVLDVPADSGETVIIESEAQSDLPIAETREAFQRALELQPNHERAMLGLGQLSEFLGSSDEALDFYLQSVDAHPVSVLSLSYLGNAYLELGRPEEAVSVFHTVLMYDPMNLFANIKIAQAYKGMSTLTVSQAADYAEHSQYIWGFLVNHLRNQFNR